MDNAVEIIDDWNQPAPNPHEDRITTILQKRAQPQQYNASQINSATNASMYRAAAGQGSGNGVQQILDAVIGNPAREAQDREYESAKGMYDMFEQKRAQGDKQANALFDKIALFTGGDPEGTALFVNELHNDPDKIDPGNAYQVMTKLAGIAKKKGYQSPESLLKKAQIKAAQSGGDKPAGVQEFEYMQKLPPDQQKAFMEMKGKGAGLQPTEMKEIFEQDDVINAGSDALSILSQMESLNTMPTYEGPLASTRAKAGSLAGSTEADNTLELDNLGQQLAASMLKTTFTGAISNAEREFLQDLQASASKTKAQRKRIIDNGRKLIEARTQRAQEKQRRIQTGEYQTTPAATSISPLGNSGALPADKQKRLDELRAKRDAGTLQ